MRELYNYNKKHFTNNNTKNEQKPTQILFKCNTNTIQLACNVHKINIAFVCEIQV